MARRAARGARADDAACVPLPDVRETCVNRSEAAIAAVQTTGTPLLTAAFVARPSLETFGALNRTLMRSEPKRGGCWGGCTKATFEADGRFEGLRLPMGPWHLRRPAAAGGRRRDDGSWRGMGAWYADQGLFCTLALRLKAYVPLGYSYPTAAQGARCLPVLHLSAPPRWECPGPRCVAARWAQARRGGGGGDGARRPRVLLGVVEAHAARGARRRWRHLCQRHVRVVLPGDAALAVCGAAAPPRDDTGDAALRRRRPPQGRAKRPRLGWRRRAWARGRRRGRRRRGVLD